MNRTARRRLLAVPLALALVALAACGDDDDNDSADVRRSFACHADWFVLPHGQQRNAPICRCAQSGQRDVGHVVYSGVFRRRQFRDDVCRKADTRACTEFDGDQCDF